MTIPDVSRTTRRRRRRRRGNRCAGWVARVCLNKICATPLPTDWKLRGSRSPHCRSAGFSFFSYLLSASPAGSSCFMCLAGSFAIFVARMGIQFNPSPRQTRSGIFSRQRADRNRFARIGTLKKRVRKNLLNFGVRDSWRTFVCRCNSREFCNSGFRL